MLKKLFFLILFINGGLSLASEVVCDPYRELRYETEVGAVCVELELVPTKAEDTGVEPIDLTRLQ